MPTCADSDMLCGQVCITATQHVPHTHNNTYSNDVHGRQLSEPEQIQQREEQCLLREAAAASYKHLSCKPSSAHSGQSGKLRCCI